MQLENNAAGLLKQSLDALAGNSLSAAQAQNAFDSSLANMGDHVTTTGKKVHFTTTSINDMSTASVALRGQLLGQVTAAEQTAEAYGQMTGSSEDGRKKLVDLRDQIIKNAVAHGVDKKAVEAYVDSVLKVPTSVPPTKFDVDKAAASQKVKEFVAVINGVPTYKDVFINVGSNAGAVVASAMSSINSIGASIFPAKRAEGSLTLANGVRAMASGGMVGHDSMIKRSTSPILWNEAPGGEAYISLAPQKRARSQAIWAETGKAIGMDVAGGGNGPVQVTQHITTSDPYEAAQTATALMTFRMRTA
jgi:hypothetical protein